MQINRRQALALGAAATAFAAAPRMAFAAAAGTPEQPPLPYAMDALEPTISARTVELHYGTHHASYFEELAELIAGTDYEGLELEEIVVRAAEAGDDEIFNNAGQAWNHNHYWAQFEAGPAAPEGRLAELVDAQFESLDGLKDRMVEEAGNVFGTGWVWLAAEGETLRVLPLEDAGNPLPEGMTPLVGIDVWEHAYYLDYEADRPGHVRAVLDNLVNWQWVGQQLGAA